MHSLNMVSIRVLDDIGIRYTVEFVSHFGFQKSLLPHSLSLALGSLSVSPLDLAAAYAVFANGGFKIEPYLIDHITDNDGHLLLQAKAAYVCNPCTAKNTDPDVIAPRVLSEEVSYLMNTALMDVVRHGTASAAASALNRKDIAGKTGTTNEQVDAWFAGYTPQLVVTTWVGFDTPTPLHEYAAMLALPLWIDFMKVALKDMPEVMIQKPATIVAVPIDPHTGLQVPSNQPSQLIEYFREQEVPALQGTLPQSLPEEFEQPTTHTQPAEVEEGHWVEP